MPSLVSFRFFRLAVARRSGKAERQVSSKKKTPDAFLKECIESSVLTDVDHGVGSSDHFANF